MVPASHLLMEATSLTVAHCTTRSQRARGPDDVAQLGGSKKKKKSQAELADYFQGRGSLNTHFG